MRARPVVPATPGRRGLGVGEVRLADGFWARLQETNARATLEHCRTWMERLGWLANFDVVAAGTTGGERPGWQFSDSEVYKLLEAMAWELARTGDPALEATYDRLVDRVAAAQDEDGYLNTCFGHAGQAGRYTDLESGHELYCTGHLLQAAVARFRTAGDGRLVEVARRAADQACAEFGTGARAGICGHPEIEVGLAELGRALGEPRYTEQARLFVERRGHGTLEPIRLLSPAYFQDDVPVREADVWSGHAVRALYLAAGAVDVAVDTGDADLLGSVTRQWERTVERRTYLTGGMGSRHQDEGFGDDWELPPDRAYCETCAGIASTMVSWRLYLATGDVRYADLMERTYYNVVATSPRSDGQAFFYANPLHQRVARQDVEPDTENPRAEGGVRAPWFDVSCCPTNVARTLASWHAYVASVDGDELTLLQYAAGEVRTALDDGGELALRVETRYPDDGSVRVEVLDAPDRDVTLRLRVPAWADGATVAGPGTGRAAHAAAPGWVEVREVLRRGDVVVLELPVAPRLTWPDPRVDAVRGCVAVERGPLVLCAESTDLPAGAALEDLRIDPTAEPRPEADGAVVRGTLLTRRASGAQSSGLPYSGVAPVHEPFEELELPLVPYHRWAERGPSTMRVFLPTL
ncbi:glycoside hydrolase family 127 protein [Cellulosimicrobium arenosum]|uniref:Glycoside hydrolase family 127 protein n=1 Tax=Cellulosimicrobium arenosum TaxID=2708133 RepID=A0A927G866_9MICO|nr:glycoside hydrolase family 127 protein [Cellulosimicrobium arenosum]